ncbi:hypothetical protein ACB092_11G110300 [Castanea dentata]
MNPNSLLTTLENLIHFSQQTLRHSLSLSISSTLHSENQNLIQCPFNPHHLIPSSATPFAATALVLLLLLPISSTTIAPPSFTSPLYIPQPQPQPLLLLLSPPFYPFTFPTTLFLSISILI